MAGWVKGGVPKDKAKINSSGLQEVDKEKESLKGNLVIVRAKLARTSKDSMMRKFWEKEVKRIEEKLGE